MKCPHCNVEVLPYFEDHFIGSDNQGDWVIAYMKCPNENCERITVDLICGTMSLTQLVQGLSFTKIKSRTTVWPLSSNRPPSPSVVDSVFANDYNEACTVLSISPKSSAALSRRCLQNILREKGNVKRSDLSKEIQEIIDRKELPSLLSESLDAIRAVGNFATHPIKSISTGEIVEVEPGEAEWLLDVIESLLDYYFVQPALLRLKKEALNIKLKDAGKPLI